MTSSHRLRETPTCLWCERTDALRIQCDGGGIFPPEFVCSDCYRGGDEGPSFDDLPPVEEAVAIDEVEMEWLDMPLEPKEPRR